MPSRVINLRSKKDSRRHSSGFEVIGSLPSWGAYVDSAFNCVIPVCTVKQRFENIAKFFPNATCRSQCTLMSTPPNDGEFAPAARRYRIFETAGRETYVRLLQSGGRDKGTPVFAGTATWCRQIRRLLLQARACLT